MVTNTVLIVAYVMGFFFAVGWARSNLESSTEEPTRNRTLTSRTTKRTRSGWIKALAILFVAVTWPITLLVLLGSVSSARMKG